MRTNGLLLERMGRSEERPAPTHRVQSGSTATSRALHLWLDSAVHDAMAPKIEVRVNELMQWADSKKGQRLLALAELRRTSYYERPNPPLRNSRWMRRVERASVGSQWDARLASAMPILLLLLPLVVRVEAVFCASWCTCLLYGLGPRVCGWDLLMVVHGQVRRCLSGWLIGCFGRGRGGGVQGEHLCRAHVCTGRTNNKNTKKRKHTTKDWKTIRIKTRTTQIYTTKEHELTVPHCTSLSLHQHLTHAVIHPVTTQRVHLLGHATSAMEAHRQGAARHHHHATRGCYTRRWPWRAVENHVHEVLPSKSKPNQSPSSPGAPSEIQRDSSVSHCSTEAENYSAVRKIDACFFLFLTSS